MRPEASVIIRAKNAERTLERAIRSVREQHGTAEVIVVDSGSRDATESMARRLADKVLTLRPDEFSYGRALNVGAAAGVADVHVALSSHCWLPDPGWLSRSLRMYDRADVAATNGETQNHMGQWLMSGQVHYQSLADVSMNPHWGMSNHGSTWRAAVWREHRFDETLTYAEDKEWALRVMRAGWTIAFASDLVVDASHVFRGSPRDVFFRQRAGHREVGRFAPVTALTLGEIRHEWWNRLPQDRHTRFAHRFLNWPRTLQLAGRYVGRREGARLAKQRDVETDR
jgi:rhamnosyltransferase